MSLDAAKNFIKVTLSTGYNSSATSVVLVAGQGALLPTAPFNAVWWNSTDYTDPADDPNVEIVRVTNIATDTLTITRGQETAFGAPAASNKNTAGKTYKMIAGLTVKTLTDIENLIVGIRPSVAYFTTAGGDTSFTITPPSGSVSSILMVVIASQQFSSSDFSQSGNNCNLTVAYSGPAGAPVVIMYTY